MKHKDIFIKGKIRGVGFTFHAMQAAYKYGVSGIAQYNDNNLLRIEAEAQEERLENFIRWCQKGPIGARVKRIEVKDGEVKNYSEFNIIQTIPRSHSTFYQRYKSFMNMVFELMLSY